MIIDLLAQCDISEKKRRNKIQLIVKINVETCESDNHLNEQY